MCLGAWPLSPLLIRRYCVNYMKFPNYTHVAVATAQSSQRSEYDVIKTFRRFWAVHKTPTNIECISGTARTLIISQIITILSLTAYSCITRFTFL